MKKTVFVPFNVQDRDSDFFQTINNAYEHIEKYIKGLDEGAFVSDSKTQDAVNMRLQQILETADKISDKSKETLKISWKKMNGLRNRISHSYVEIDPEIIWETITALPEFQQLLDWARKKSAK